MTHLQANFLRLPDRPECPSASPRDAMHTCPYDPLPITRSRCSRYAGRRCSDGVGDSVVTAGGGKVSGGGVEARM